MSSFEGRAIQIIGNVVQITDDVSGHSIFIPLSEIAGGQELRLWDRVRIEGSEACRRGRRLVEALTGQPSPFTA
ncbi:MAG: hypothetical protein EA356_10340 [Geminicoccaceae bacterium]|nr:MAG: hypothetical protein EA356_10340 [Geminicoccaceae bacterium]